MSVGDQTAEGQASRWYQSVDWILVEICVTAILCGVAISSWLVGVGLLVVFAGLSSRADGRWSLATLSGFCWVGLGATGWTRFSGLQGGAWVGLALGGAVFFAHLLLPPAPPMPRPETRAEMHKAQVERAARDVLVIAMILLALFGFFWVGAADHAAPVAKPPAPAPASLRAPLVPPLKAEL